MQNIINISAITYDAVYKWFVFVAAVLWGGVFFLSASAQPGAAIINGKFIDTKTGTPFVPTGFNYVRLDATGHSTFNPATYQHDSVARFMQKISQSGFKMVRVFINNRVSPYSIVDSAGSKTLNPRYITNVADFLMLAQNYKLFVIVSIDFFPTTKRYHELIGNPITGISGMNQHYLHPGFIAAKKQFIIDFLTAINAANANAYKGIGAVDLQNELCYFIDAPFTLSSGMVTPANGKTYDLKNNKQALADESAIYWCNQCVDAIHSVIPGVLTDANIFTYHAVGRTGPGDWHSDAADWKNRVPFRLKALTGSTVSILDVHLYPSNTREIQTNLSSIEWGDSKPLALGKGLLVGEFGCFKSTFPNIAHGNTLMGKTADTIFSYGFDGWLYWTYNCWEQPDLWNAMESSGTIYKTLEASILGHGATGMITVKPWGTIGPVPSSKSKVTMSYTSGVFDMAGRRHTVLKNRIKVGLWIVTPHP